MKKLLCGFALFLASANAISQKYEFQPVKDIPCEPVISQDATGTCWSFSTTSFLEAEILRKTGKHVDLSEMYNVRHTYPKKVYNYVMRQGHAQFGEGGLSHDVIYSAKEFGLMPQSAYSGLTPGSDKYNHQQLEKELEEVAKKNATSKSPDAAQWKAEVSTILDKYMGVEPADFTFEGKKYTAKSFLEMTKLDLSDYVTITSFTQSPFYSNFILDIPDNFAYGSFYNLPLDEFVKNIDNALEKGYTLALDTDVSEPTFSGKAGVAVLPENTADAAAILSEIKPEKNVTQEFRQHEYENFDTQDDHLMHIVGKVKDQKGNLYYKVKNSWGTDAKSVANGGFVYMSVPYLKLKAISVMVHKDGLLPATKKALKI
ncbi:C1 family peptidase [Flavobacterium silvaticum]|uniref:Aminopeptidase n=1 Tax=Flavobacterium silvaticum TaxID=1852020 RepID=A0A972FVS7_9FLAO|nr:C1 family peptidase [Flavobacterium silvaticum]NMH28942.1 aminopeptidase [Flavobacterium silvaticum]